LKLKQREENTNTPLEKRQQLAPLQGEEEEPCLTPVTTAIPPPSTLPTTAAPPLGRSNAEAAEKRKNDHSHTPRHH
jgi:hypothetical protein